MGNTGSVMGATVGLSWSHSGGVGLVSGCQSARYVSFQVAKRAVWDGRRSGGRRKSVFGRANRVAQRFNDAEVVTQNVSVDKRFFFSLCPDFFFLIFLPFGNLSRDRFGVRVYLPNTVRLGFGANRASEQFGIMAKWQKWQKW
jgi:hypothetical protein